MTTALRTASLHLPKTVRSWVRITRNAALRAHAVLPAQPSPYGDEPCPLT